MVLQGARQELALERPVHAATHACVAGLASRLQGRLAKPCLESAAWYHHSLS
jgi:hypothetical protein